MSISLAESLANQGQGMVYSMAFGNGGDRIEGKIPEADYCDSMGVDMVWGLGKKVQSSSWLIERSNNQELDYNKPRQYRSNQGRSPEKMTSNYKMLGWSLIGFWQSRKL